MKKKQKIVLVIAMTLLLLCWTNSSVYATVSDGTTNKNTKINVHIQGDGTENITTVIVKTEDGQETLYDSTSSSSDDLKGNKSGHLFSGSDGGIKVSGDSATIIVYTNDGKQQEYTYTAVPKNGSTTGNAVQGTEANGSVNYWINLGTGGGDNPPTDDGGGVTNPPVDDGGGVTNPPVDDGGGTTNPPVDDGGGTTNPPVDDGGGTTNPPVDGGGGTTNPSGNGGNSGSHDNNPTTIVGSDTVTVPDEQTPAGSAALDPAETIVLDEAVPNGPAKLPDTGEVPMAVYFTSGIAMILTGFKMRKE